MGRDPTPAQAVVAEINQAGGEAAVSGHDVSDWGEAEALIGIAVETFGDLHIVVNNAGILRDRSFAKMNLDDFRLVLDVHVMGAVNATKAVWPHMCAQSYGRIVMTTSPPS